MYINYNYDDYNIIESDNNDNNWNFVDKLNYKDKIKSYMKNKYIKILPIIYYSTQLVKNNSYMNIFINSTNIINNITNNIDNNNIKYYYNKIEDISTIAKYKIDILYDDIKYQMMPLIESFKLQYNNNQALKLAYLTMLNICYNLIIPYMIEINTKLYKKYENNIIIDNINTEFYVIYNNNKYIYVYHQFLFNKCFQKDLQNYINNSINNILLDFIIYDNLKDYKFIIKLKYNII